MLRCSIEVFDLNILLLESLATGYNFEMIFGVHKTLAVNKLSKANK